MHTDILAAAVALSDRDLLARIDALATSERETTAELVAHLAALELRPSLYAARGYGSLFDYCTRALRLSEDAACNRIRAARTSRHFPVVLELLAKGSISLSTIRILQPHLTFENHLAVLARAANQKRGRIEALAVELAPRPDVASTVRRLPGRAGALLSSGTRPMGDDASASLDTGLPPPAVAATGSLDPHPAAMTAGGSSTASSEKAPVSTLSPPAPSPPAAQRSIVQASSPHRYRVQFTMGQAAHDDLRCLQELLRREIPSGDPALIVERALALLRLAVEKAKLGTTRSGRPAAERGAAVTDPRPQAERPTAGSAGIAIRRAADKPTRHIPNAVRRAVWSRDSRQCAFVSADGRRCAERAFLELHHIRPFALDGPPTCENIALRCRRHNQYEGELVFGRRAVDIATLGTSG